MKTLLMVIFLVAPSFGFASISKSNLNNMIGQHNQSQAYGLSFKKQLSNTEIIPAYQEADDVIDHVLSNKPAKSSLQMINKETKYIKVACCGHVVCCGDVK